ncbi:16S rRNA (uracil(1498)-N(3))-methyltransferase [Cycloclasticus pugetii]|uniref:16S rRNA (uracil(1498)-N(3))-methyltransferase n=1 Tax=Cycloclasticus pugetii TaxID=34068 RepID=UPI00091D4757|nr:16S rRNA (uracil(1498)-N(3))-methyltransferase [Cycloclasticus pugetii]SHI76060.1 16S rRNA m(3)U-1498 methyltransferase [Cycloclasticus pugetii]
MRISRLFVEQDLVEGAAVTLEADAAHYLRNVLRLKKGFQLTVFNGQGGEYAATVQEVHRKAVVLELGAWRNVELESPLQIELGLSVSRGERMDVAIQKATELGVAVITPVITQYCVVKLTEERRLQRHQHWQNIVYRACEQCGRNKPPILNVTMDLAQWLNTELAASRIIFEPGKADTLRNYPKPNDAVAVLIGPEGGFSEQEVLDAQEVNFSALGFGPRVVRNETAAIASIAAMQVLWGDMG